MKIKVLLIIILIINSFIYSVDFEIKFKKPEEPIRIHSYIKNSDGIKEITDKAKIEESLKGFALGPCTILNEDFYLNDKNERKKMLDKAKFYLKNSELENILYKEEDEFKLGLILDETIELFFIFMDKDFKKAEYFYQMNEVMSAKGIPNDLNKNYPWYLKGLYNFKKGNYIISKYYFEEFLKRIIKLRRGPRIKLYKENKKEENYQSDPGKNIIDINEISRWSTNRIIFFLNTIYYLYKIESKLKNCKKCDFYRKIFGHFDTLSLYDKRLFYTMHLSWSKKKLKYIKKIIKLN